MIYKHFFEIVHKSFINTFNISDPKSLSLPFEKKVVVLDVDFMSNLHVIRKNTRKGVVNTSLNLSYLCKFCQNLTLGKK